MENTFLKTRTTNIFRIRMWKGQFIAQMASQHPENNYIAIDLVDAMLGLAKRNIESAYKKIEKRARKYNNNKV